MAFVHGAGNASRKPVLDRLTYLVQCDSVVGHGLSVWNPSVEAHSLSGLDFDVGRARNPLDGRSHARGEHRERVKVIAVEL